MSDRDTILTRLRQFAEQQAAAVEAADHDSLARAADIVELYEDKSWVGEMDPPKQRAVRGRPVDPESFSRFTKWLAERVPIQGRTAYQLKAAHERANYLRGAQVNPSGEFSLRPLGWFEKNDYTDKIPEVWELACALALGGTPDQPTVRKAITQWKNDHLPKSDRKTRQKTAGRRARIAKWREDALNLLHEDPAEFARALKAVEQAVEAELDSVLGPAA